MSKLIRSAVFLLGGGFAVSLVACSSDSPAPSGADTGASGASSTTTAQGGAAGSTDPVIASDSAAPSEAASLEDASTALVDAAAAGDVVVVPGDAGGARSKKAYLCNLVIGTSVVYDWFTSGFETALDGNRWEGLASPQAGMSFIQMWNDPMSPLWSMAKVTPCTQQANAPDRVIFQGVNWEYTTAAQWVTQLDAIVKLLQVKFPGIKEIDLMTMLRAPNNMTCGNIESVVQPFVDEAITTVAAKYPGLVEIAPKMFAPSCNVFTGGGPHYTDAGKQTIAKLYSDYYVKEP